MSIHQNERLVEETIVTITGKARAIGINHDYPVYRRDPTTKQLFSIPGW